MTVPAPAGQSSDTGNGAERSPSSGRTWFRTREGHHYGWEIALIIVVKLALLVVLWFVFIVPWSRPAKLPVAVVHQFYAPAGPSVRHD